MDNSASATAEPELDPIESPDELLVFWLLIQAAG